LIAGNSNDRTQQANPPAITTNATIANHAAPKSSTAIILTQSSIGVRSFFPFNDKRFEVAARVIVGHLTQHQTITLVMFTDPHPAAQNASCEP